MMSNQIQRCQLSDTLYSTMRGCLIAAILIATCTAGSKAQDHGEAGAAPHSIGEQALSSISDIKTPDIYQPDCDRPAQREDDDLCQQRRMAKAAESSLYWGKVQFVAGLAGTAGLLVTIFLSIKATRAAVRAAEIAEVSVATSRDTAQRQLRAYVCFDGATTKTNPGMEGGFAVSVHIKNTGLTPAYGLSQWAKIALEEFPLKKEFPPHEPKFKDSGVFGPQGRAIIAPTFERKLSHEEIDAILQQKKAIYVFGAVTYRDAFKEDRFTRFCIQCSGHQAYSTGLFKACDKGNEAN